MFLLFIFNMVSVFLWFFEFLKFGEKIEDFFFFI